MLMSRVPAAGNECTVKSFKCYLVIEFGRRSPPRQEEWPTVAGSSHSSISSSVGVNKRVEGRSTHWKPNFLSVYSWLSVGNNKLQADITSSFSQQLAYGSSKSE
ncbi:hypothetical protein CEXT_373281 [Caerostris extrusa]|uniref:Uncharacterized protein n=1 Tax=Caerostris extrusa TaxID=172846 RepID=A0AAV4QGR6_CAEEX|nr:hypothetical protein CEXT_373281 [Caerostris extrusa]